MNVRRLITTAAATGLLTCGALASAGAPALAAGTSGATSLSASGSGADESGPNGGDPGARITGSFQLTPAGALTYTVRVTGSSEPVTSGHIHRGAAGTNGDVVVPLDTAALTAGTTATTQIDPALAAQIIADPGGFYLNAHSATFAPPAGVARGQLTAGSSGAPGSIGTGTGGQAAQDGGSAAWLVGGTSAVVVVGAVAVVRRRRAGTAA